MSTREVCFRCYRPKSSCMCGFIKSFNTNTKFVILMHPKEYRKTKNGTGHLTNLSLKNSEIIIGIDFSNNKRVNELIEDNNSDSFLLYPSSNSITLNKEKIGDDRKKKVIFIIDSTWACSKKIIRLSDNLKTLPKISFEFTKSSDFKIKNQPSIYCLSTIESVFCVLKHLNNHKIENINRSDFSSFLNPFEEMVAYQLRCTQKCQIRNKAVEL